MKAFHAFYLYVKQKTLIKITFTYLKIREIKKKKKKNPAL